MELWLSVELCLWSKQNMQTLPGSADILTIKISCSQKQVCKPQKDFYKWNKICETWTFHYSVWWTVCIGNVIPVIGKEGQWFAWVKEYNS